MLDALSMCKQSHFSSIDADGVISPWPWRSGESIARNSQWMSVAVSCRLRQAIQECTLTFGIEPCCTTHAAGILRRAVSFQKTGVSYLSEKNVPETCIE